MYATYTNTKRSLLLYLNKTWKKNKASDVFFIIYFKYI